MEPCLIDNQICSEQHMRCKECKLNDCREAMKMAETYEEETRRIQIERMRKTLPAGCRKCSHLEIVSIKDKKVYCPYMIKDCLLRGGYGL